MIRQQGNAFLIGILAGLGQGLVVTVGRPLVLGHTIEVLARLAIGGGSGEEEAQIISPEEGVALILMLCLTVLTEGWLMTTSKIWLSDVGRCRFFGVVQDVRGP